MLKLVNIVKDYKVGGGNVINALRGVSMEFRQSEFVSVLGPSGCGKTTLLNIIGGLDHATAGDLLIYSKSTKKYKDRDWDVYRNHRIGFVFQSYNLIPHQTVLGNVELSLTIAGLSKTERVERAKKALDKVGLSDQYNKKPNQLSGGQSQRVAIARALVNDPEILLADEPTGALDTVTSKQIMELVKEISKERLVIMVTHNPEIAEFYSTRIIRLLDGKLLSDTNPFSESDERREAAILDKKEKEIQAEYDAIKADIIGKEDSKNKEAEEKIAAEKLKEEQRIDKKAAALINISKCTQCGGNIEINNARKEGKCPYCKAIYLVDDIRKLSYEEIRTLILQEEVQKKLARQALETEKKNKEIDKKASNELSRKHKKEKAKMSFFTAFKLSLKNLFSKKARTIMTSVAGSIGIIGVSLVLAISSGVTNFINDMQNDMLSGSPIEIARVSFDINALVESMSTQQKLDFIKEKGYVNIDSMMETLVKREEDFGKIIGTQEIKKNYVDFVQEMPKKWLSALFLDYGLDVSNNIYTSFKGENGTHDVSLTGIKAIYSSVLSKTDYAKYSSMIDSLSQSFKQAPDAEEYIRSQYDILHGDIAKEKEEIMIVLGKDSVLNDLLLAQLGYYSQEEFINLVYKAAKDSRHDASIDRYYNAEKDKYEISYDDLIGKEFTWYKNDSLFTKNTDNSPAMQDVSFTYDAFHKGDNGIQLKIAGILEPNENLSFGSLSTGFYYTTDLAEYIIEQNRESQIAKYLEDKTTKSFLSSVNASGTRYTGIIFDYEYTYEGNKQPAVGLIGKASQMETMMSLFGIGGDYGFTLQKLGGNVEDLGNGNYFALPNSIAIYPKNLDEKAHVLEYLDRWNSNETIKVNGVWLTPPGSSGGRTAITYSDPLTLIMSMIRQMVEIITIALIGFTSLSLVVSCVMIGIITYVSVVERIKEIGVIRSLGGRKRDVSNLFVAETGIIGLISGVFGIIVTYLLSFVVNLIVWRFADIGNLAIAALPWWQAAIMIGVSVLLTLISGAFPARAAARKDPVVALRTE